jgi:hypothetical protein
MRRLEPPFMEDFGANRTLYPLLEAIKRDRDLALEIRDNYVNVYFRGYSIAKVEKNDDVNYRITIHNLFCPPELGLPANQVAAADETQLDQPDLIEQPEAPMGRAIYNVYVWRAPNDAAIYVRWLPFVKQRALELRRYANELEVEQWVIRAGSREAMLAQGCKPDYLAIDRQAITPDRRGRVDVLGYCWRFPRQQNQRVPLVVLEVKHLLNNEIQDVQDQLWMYHEWVSDPAHLAALADELEMVAKQKAQLGLLRPEVATLRVDRNPFTIRYAMVLVDYNPRSELLPRLKQKLVQKHLEGGRSEQFVQQLELFQLGFAMWERHRKSGEDLVLG